MSKNIAIFSDGTGQEGGKGPDTNVYKLFKICENRTENQITFYDRGLGTSAQSNFAVRALGNATGSGISRNLLDCYRFIFDNYMAGDKIYLFGFSRGAATVRSLAGFVEMFGIIPKSRPDLIDVGYGIYRISDIAMRKKAATDFVKQHHNMWAPIEFLGVWDTVAALGLPWEGASRLLNKVPWFKHEFHDLDLTPAVRNAYHALSIDDDRRVFHPVLWNQRTAPNQIMQQTWFAGVHTDVGGGYAEAGLSDITMAWMLGHAKRCGLLIHKKSGKALQKSLKPDYKIDTHNPRAGAAGWFYSVENRMWPDKDGNGEDRGQPQVHSSVLERAKTSQLSYKPWILERNPVEEPPISRTAHEKELQPQTE
ncbi:DUF2235 domain-containing protein [Pseudovibrio sp. Tun.PSC04-5.I4]|uniref:DUF2235 domain-containing protein n=1 Tax=Pseudovibrio sp. Tun.PSC04-5.I4 TaxID=1798213 RepID=UPI0008919B0F|nr:DUF2235 domain-containing protein [Pseudovibrio sp. Tun.PSC04-5.I4]SDR47664.1 Uncharacterized protein, PA2063/DUF2235 family [Pseudovibrio sp. Tun.PSC04-5.I4]